MFLWHLRKPGFIWEYKFTFCSTSFVNNSKLIDTGSTVQTPRISEKNSCSGKSTTPAVAAQRPPLSPIPVAPAVTPVNTHRPIHIPDPLDFDLLFPLPPSLLTEVAARKSKTFKHQKSIDYKRTSPALQNKFDEPTISANVTYLKTASDISSETFSLFYPKTIFKFILHLFCGWFLELWVRNFINLLFATCNLFV